MHQLRHAAGWWLPGLLLAASPLLSLSATAQSAKPALTVPEIRACTCQERKIELMRAQTADKNAAYKDRLAQVKRLTDQINQLSATMSPEDSLAQDQLGELIDLRSRVQQQVRESALPALQRSTNALNAEVNAYNSNCADRTIFQTDDTEAQQNLSCPKL